MGESVGAITAAEFGALALKLEHKGRLEFTIATGSMRPLIPVGAKIEVEPLGSDREPRRFDILVFWNGSVLVCHYLWSINELRDPGEASVYITRNLNRGGEDLPVPREHVLGRVVNFRLSRLRRFALLWAR